MVSRGINAAIRGFDLCTHNNALQQNIRAVKPDYVHVLIKVRSLRAVAQCWHLNSRRRDMSGWNQARRRMIEYGDGRS